jgi:nucleotide-binding universal stress UspA family protein
MLRTLLVPLDGSPLAETALRPASELARQTGASLVLLRAAPHADTARPLPIEQRFTVRDARRYLEAVADRLRRDHCRVEIDVLEGEAPLAILYSIDHRHPDLVVLSTHGYTGLRRLVLGSVSEQVLRESSAPVMVVRAAAHSSAGVGPPRKVLVPLDGSACAEAALTYLLDAGLAPAAELILLRAVPFIMSAVAVPGLPDPNAQRLLDEERMRVQQRLLEARHYLDTVARRMPHGQPYGALAVADYPARAIVQMAEKEGVDLIAMATNSRTGMDRIMHASVTAHVLHHTPTPILIVRRPAAAHIQPRPIERETPASVLAAMVSSAAGGAGPVDGED